MSENKESEIAVDIGDQSVNQDTETTKDSASADELKQQAGELLKAAGGLAGSFGRFAVKKGSQLKEKIEDEEFQEKINNNIKAVTDKIDDFVSSDSVRDRKTVSVKGVVEEPKVEQSQAIKQTSKPKEVKRNEIETSFEVEGNETVNFETKKAPKGIAKAIEQGKAERKAAKEKKKAEKERKRKEEQKRSLILGGVGVVLLIIMLAVMGHGGNGHEGQVQAPLSSIDAYDLNYEDVIKQFEDAGFTNVETMKMEDLVIGWLSSDGGVDKITIDGDEEYSTSSWYDPDAKVFVYYHTYPPEAAEEPKSEPTNEGTSSEDKSKLQAFIGETVADADLEIKALGYTPKYIALNNGADMTSDIEYSDNKDAWKIKSMDDFDANAKIVSYMVATKEIEEIVEKRESAKSKLSDNEARDIAYKWINNNWSSSFRMKDIVLGDKCSIIEEEAFEYCKYLENINLFKVSTIQTGAFQYCESLRSVELDGLNIVESSCFHGCTELSEVHFGRVKTVKDRAFIDCEALTEIEIPDSLSVIEDCAFSGSGIQNVTIPKTVQSVGMCCFGGAKCIRFYDNIRGDRLKLGKLFGTSDRMAFDVTVFDSIDDAVKYIAPFYCDGSWQMKDMLNSALKEDNSFDFSQFDSYFSMIKDKNMKPKVAVFRLMHPYDLNEYYKKSYEEFLKNNASASIKFCIEDKDVESFKILFDIGLINSRNVSKYKKLAKEKGADDITKLLDETY